MLLGLGGLATAIVIGGLVAVGYVFSVAQSAPSLDSLQPKLAGASSQVFAANGTRLGFIQSDVLRSPITTAQMPGILRKATVAIEDQRFYKNNGVDLTGVFRAAVKDV
ncbi:MAG: transglycosylase domain-containing protein, partial [Solirubrobacteraceae bacterium]